jgi:hypothetical protein
MNLDAKVKSLVMEPLPRLDETRRANIKLAAQLCTARARIAALEAENTGLRDSLRVLNRHEALARDFAAIREAERTACAALVHSLGLTEAAKRIQERE